MTLFDRFIQSTLKGLRRIDLSIMLIAQALLPLWLRRLHCDKTGFHPNLRLRTWRLGRIQISDSYCVYCERAISSEVTPMLDPKERLERFLDPYHDPHTHRCVDYPGCDGEWSHSPAQSERIGHSKAHRCPKCNKFNFNRIDVGFT